MPLTHNLANLKDHLNSSLLVPRFSIPSLKVPSAYLMTDVFLALDGLLGKKLFHPDRKAGEDRMRVAGREALKCKRLVGALRALWRSSKESHDDRVHHLKTFLRASPTRCAAPPSEPGEEPAPALADGSSSEGDQESGSSRSDMSDDGSVPRDPSVEPENEPVGNLTESDSSDNKSKASHGTLSADTLELGKEASVEEVSDTDSENYRDSQVSSGWMGKAIMWGNKMVPSTWFLVFV